MSVGFPRSPLVTNTCKLDQNLDAHPQCAWVFCEVRTLYLLTQKEHLVAMLHAEEFEVVPPVTHRRTNEKYGADIVRSRGRVYNMDICTLLEYNAAMLRAYHFAAIATTRHTSSNPFTSNLARLHVPAIRR
jgi:hypothetical protein